MKRFFLVLFCLLSVLGLKANHWNPDPYQFSNSMNVVGVVEINGLEQATDALELGAFCDSDCRGSEMLTFYPGLNRYLVFLTIYGESGNEFMFRLYDHNAHLELNADCEQTITFVADEVVGNTIDPYVFAFTGEISVYTVDARPMPDTAGIVVGMGTFFENDTCTLSATPNVGFAFVDWTEDGQSVSTCPDYTFPVTSNRILIANFSLITYEISVEAVPENGGTVIGSGLYGYGSLATVEAQANDTYHFINWKEDGEVVSTEAVYAFVVDRPRRLVASFAQICYVVTVAADPAQGGTVQGGGNYIEGSTCHLKASPAQNYEFAYWTEADEVVSTESEWSFVVDDNRGFVAHFVYYDGVGEQENTLLVYPNPTEGTIQVEGVTGSTVRLFDLNGRLLLALPNGIDKTQLDLTPLSKGCYFLQMGNVTRKVVKR